MGLEYYGLIRSYATQDSALLGTFLIAVTLMAGWSLIRKFKMAWLESLYFAQIIVIYACLLYVFGRLPIQ